VADTPGPPGDALQPVAGGDLLGRRALLTRGLVLAQQVDRKSVV